MLNQEYIDNLNKAVDQCTDCSQINKLLLDIENYFDTRLAEIEKKISLLAPLVTIPSTIGDVISWVSNFITANLLGPYNKLIALEAEVIAAQASLMSALASKISSLKCDIPPIGNFGIGGSGFGSQMFGSTN